MRIAIVTVPGADRLFFQSDYDLILSTFKIRTKGKTKNFVVKLPEFDPQLQGLALACLVIGRLKIDEILLPASRYSDREIPQDESYRQLVTSLLKFFASKATMTYKPTVAFYLYLSDKKWLQRVPTRGRLSANTILLGGGTDSGSSIAAARKLLGGKVTGLFYEFGQTAARHELVACQKITSSFDAKLVHVKVKLKKLRKQLDEFPSISSEGPFPARNWFFYTMTLGLLGRQSKSIAISVFRGEFDDNHADHGPTTLGYFQRLCDLFSDQPLQIKVTVPSARLDKSDTAYWWKQIAEKTLSINETRSCYKKTSVPCGTCVGCVNRYVAMSYAGFNTEACNWETYPAKAEMLSGKYLERALDPIKCPEARSQEIAFVLATDARKWLSVRLRNRVDYNSTLQYFAAQALRRATMRNAGTIGRVLKKGLTTSVTQLGGQK